MIRKIKGAARLRIFLNIVFWIVFMGLTLQFLLAVRFYYYKVTEPPELAAVMAYCIFFLIILLPYVARLFKTNIKRDIGRYMEAHPHVTMELLEQDFAMAENCGLTVWIGRNYLFHFQSTYKSASKQGLTVIQKDQIVWAYTKKEQQSVAMWEYSVCVALADGTEHKLRLTKNQQEQLMEYLEQLYYVVIGYRPEYAYQFRHEREAFLERQYNQYAHSHIGRVGL